MSLARVAGAGVRLRCVDQLLKYLLQQDLPWTSFSASNGTSHCGADPCHVRHPPSSRQEWMFKDPRSQVSQYLSSVSLLRRGRNKVDVDGPLGS